MLFRLSRVWILSLVGGCLNPLYAGSVSTGGTAEFPKCHVVGTLAIGALSEQQERSRDYIVRVSTPWRYMSSISVQVGELRDCEFVDGVTQQLTCADVFVTEFPESSLEQIQSDKSRALWMAKGAAGQYSGIGFVLPKTSEPSFCPLGYDEQRLLLN